MLRGNKNGARAAALLATRANFIGTARQKVCDQKMSVFATRSQTMRLDVSGRLRKHEPGLHNVSTECFWDKGNPPKRNNATL
jgi:hypothetical protein